MDRPIWIKGIHDTLLTMVSSWFANYDKGVIVTYRKRFDGTEQEAGIVPMERQVILEMRDDQLKTIVDLFEYTNPTAIETKYFKEYYEKKFSKCQRIRGRIRSVPFVVPKDVVKRILQLMLLFKQGKLQPYKEGGKPVILEQGSTETGGLFAEVED